jgi:hypothetical protein
MSEIDEILLDGHVHFHSAFSRRLFFDGALANLRSAAAELGLAADTVGCLMFTESCGAKAFEVFLQEASGAPRSNGENCWSFVRTDEGNSLWAVRDSGPHRLLLIAGRQLVTREGLEVLALGRSAALADREPLRTAIDATLAAGAIPVVPWGFGKWWGRRGALLAELLHRPGERRFFVGDNSGRAALLPRPRLFETAAQNGIFVLPGSDPLPFAPQTTKAGRCGFRMRVALDERRPAEQVLAMLRDCERQPQVFGRYESLSGFVGQQVAMQLRKRRPGAARRELP